MSKTVCLLAILLWMLVAVGPRAAQAQALKTLLAQEFAQWEAEAKKAGLEQATIDAVLRLGELDKTRDAKDIFDTADQLRKSYPNKTSLGQLLDQVQAQVPSASGGAAGHLPTPQQRYANDLLRQLDDSLLQDLRGRAPSPDQLASQVNAAWRNKVAQLQTTEEALETFQMYLLLAAIVALVLALLGYLLGARARKPPVSSAEPNLEEKYRRQKDLAERLEGENRRLEAEKQQLGAQWAQQRATLEARLSALESPGQTVGNPEQPPATQVPASPAVFYAKFADREQPLGFTLRNLSQEMDDEKVFVIEVLSETEAQYRIVATNGAFVKANQIMAYFKEACSFDQSPTQAHHLIETLAPGKLAKDRDCWQIMQKAKVRFV
jgi:hypothetical protein